MDCRRERANHEELRRLRAGLFNDLLRGRRVLGVPAQAQRRMDLDGPTEAHGGEIELAFCQPANVIGRATFAAINSRFASIVAGAILRP